jgi:hypothetical protein
MKISLIVAAIAWLIPSSSKTPASLVSEPIRTAVKSGNQSYQALEDWQMHKLKDGIQVYTRWIMTSSNRKTRQVKGTTTIQARQDQITRLITNETLARQWMVFLDELKYYQLDGKPDEWYSYGRINVLGKWACFDVVTNNHLLPENSDRQTQIVMNDASGYLPDKSGVHRITGLYSSWSFTALGKDQIRVDYTLYTDMKPVIPPWMTEPVVSALMISTLSHFREKALSDKPM